MPITIEVPQDKTIDSTLDLTREGYLFIKNRLDEFKSSIFESRILGQRVVCMTGQEAAKIFYDSEYFQRNGAAPKRVQNTLFGKNAIQAMDGEEHVHRKKLFMSLMKIEDQKSIASLVFNKLLNSVQSWEEADKIVLFDESKYILCWAACKWACVPLEDSEVKERAEDFAAMVDSFGAIGPHHWNGLRAREKTEDWIRQIIIDVRSGKLQVKKESALNAMSFHRMLDGKLLDEQMAAIELINILRPIVAISTFITFSALALYDHPECIKKLKTSDDGYLQMFVQEVRRYFPFTPFVAARARKDFIWHNCNFKEGELVLLDVYGMNHSNEMWKNPYEFEPERFNHWNDSTFNFIPQGGGDPANGHRCPGEGITIEIMKSSLNFLVNYINYNVPEQDFNYSLSKIPTLPKSGFIMNNIKRKF